VKRAPAWAATRAAEATTAWAEPAQGAAVPCFAQIGALTRRIRVAGVLDMPDGPVAAFVSVLSIIFTWATSFVLRCVARDASRAGVHRQERR